MKKNLIILFILIITLTFGCGKDVDNQINNQTTKQTTTKKLAPKNSKMITAKDLKLYIPSGIDSDPSNGNGTYSYYLETDNDWCDIDINIINKDNYTSASEYLVKEYTINNPISVSINNINWYKASAENENGGITYYLSTIHQDKIYIVRLFVATNGEICSPSLNMIENSLTF